MITLGTPLLRTKIIPPIPAKKFSRAEASLIQRELKTLGYLKEIFWELNDITFQALDKAFEALKPKKNWRDLPAEEILNSLRSIPGSTASIRYLDKSISFGFQSQCPLLTAGTALHLTFGKTQYPHLLKARVTQLVSGHAVAKECLGMELEIPANSLVENLGERIIKKAPSSFNAEGAKAALEFERSYRSPNSANRPFIYWAFGGRTDGGKPIPLSDLKNVHPVRTDLWNSPQLIDDFKKNKKPEEQVILLVLKGEICSQHISRYCAISTAVIEKKSTPLLNKCRIYIAWVKHPDSYPNNLEAARAKEALDNMIIQTHQYDQPPGANFIFINPYSPTLQIIRTDARTLGLNMIDLENEDGKTPQLQSEIEEVLKRFHPPFTQP